MTPEDFKLKMLEISRNGDIEDAHSKADDLMCELLKTLGYTDGVAIFDSMDKWCA